MHLRWQVLHEIPHPLMNGWGGDNVEVIEHEDNLLSLMAHQFIGQGLSRSKSSQIWYTALREVIMEGRRWN
jgi:hypothetical protein